MLLLYCLLLHCLLLHCLLLYCLLLYCLLLYSLIIKVVQLNRSLECNGVKTERITNISVLLYHHPLHLRINKRGV